MWLDPKLHRPPGESLEAVQGPGSGVWEAGGRAVACSPAGPVCIPLK